MTLVLVDATGAPVALPHLVGYERRDGATWYARVEAVSSPPDPSSRVIQRRDRGALQVRHGPTVDGPWGPPHYGIDPVELDLRIVVQP